MALFTNAARNLMLEALAGVADTAGLLEGPDEGDELSGGDYSRQSISWDSAASGSLSTDDDLVFTIPGPATLRRLGFWDDTTYLGSIPLSQEREIDGPAVHRVQVATVDLDNEDS